MKRIVFVTTRDIYPITGGREVVLYNYCKGLVKDYGCEVNLISFSEEEKSITPDFIKKQYYVSQPNSIEKIKNLIFKSIITRKYPLQVSLYYSKRTQNEINNIIDKLNPNIVICDMARTAEYVKNIPSNKIKKILDMDDLLSKRYFRQADNSTIQNNILGQYSKKVPNFINNLLSSPKIKKVALKMEGKLLSKYEKEIEKYFERVIFVSPKECKEYNKIINKEKSLCLTIGVDYEYYSKKIGENEKKIICFLGNMYVPHNQEAVEYFLNNIFEYIKEENSDVIFRIIGKCSSEYKEKHSVNGVEVTGEVEDIRRYVQESRVSIAPLTFGSGIKTKVLETMAMGVPVVTNEIGVEGINVKDKYDIFICENNLEYIERINQLLNNKDIADQIASNAQKTIRESYIWEKTLQPVKEILN